MLSLEKANQSTTNEPILVLEKIKKIYSSSDNSYMALKGIDLKINKGEFVAFVGKSGSGKSTLLNILSGIDKPTEGSIQINNKDISSLSENKLSAFRGKNIGFVFQFFQLIPTLTNLENVIMPMDFLKKLPSSQRKAKAEMLLDKVGILKHADKFPSNLSGGEQQRVAIARALANDPQIILADEPTGNLDTKTTEDVFNLLSSLSLEGKTIIMVTHNNDIAKRCGRIIRIRDGLIVEDIRNKTNEG